MVTRSDSYTVKTTTAEIARDADDVDFSVDDVHSALTLARPSQTDRIDKRKTAIQGHSGSSVVRTVVVPNDATIHIISLSIGT